MSDRRKLGFDLDELQQQLRELEIHYEQYFAGVEKREPLRDRTDLARKLRSYTNRRIVWTDLKFRYQGLAQRFNSYCNYWDRILRLIDEGKYHRHTTKLQSPSAPPSATRPLSSEKSSDSDELLRLHAELRNARQSCGLSGDAPSKAKLAEFLATQREKIRSRYGDQPVEFKVDISDGKPSIKVSRKK